MSGNEKGQQQKKKNPLRWRGNCLLKNCVLSFLTGFLFLGMVCVWLWAGRVSSSDWAPLTCTNQSPILLPLSVCLWAKQHWFPCTCLRTDFMWIGNYSDWCLYSKKKCWVVSNQSWVKWTNPNVGLKMHLKNVQLKAKV